MEITRVSTGIPGLDEMTNGGFEKNSAILICGSGGSGKTIFGTQFLLEGIEKHGETGIYISFEERKDKFYKHMEVFGWDLKASENQGRFVFTKYSPKKMMEIVKGGGKEIEGVIKEINAKRIVIDSLSAYVALFKDESEQREMLVALFDMIANWECTCIVIAEEDQDPEKRNSTVMGFMADAIIYLYEIRKEETMTRAIEVAKMRGTKHNYRIVPLTIDARGITIHPKDKVF